jgi:hypothetical protein
MMETLYEKILKDEKAELIFKGALRDAFFINADNVASYFWESNDKDEWDTEKDYPNIAPPFYRFYIEHALPKDANINGEKRHNHLADVVDRVGVFFTGLDVEKPPEDAFRSNDPALIRYKSNGVRWVLYAQPFILYKNSTFRQLDFMYVMHIKPDGSLYVSGGVAVGVIAPKNVNGDAAFKIFTGILGPSLLAISFMHCKNVHFVAHDPLRRSGKRSNRYGPKVKYYTLEIEPMKTILRTEGEIEHNGLRRSLHICRGHFKDYRDKGLFGKFKDIYWWDAHARGNIAAGVVGKDYSVNTDSRNPVVRD